MLFPFYGLAMLALESTSVINKRLTRIGLGGTQAFEEVLRMFAEKSCATFEASGALMLGGTAAGMIARFREQVAENEARLSSRSHVSTRRS